MTPLDLFGYFTVAALLTTAASVATFLLARALIFLLFRLHFLSLFLRNSVNSHLLNGPTVMTRSLIYAEAAFQRWRLFESNNHSIEGIEWPKDALEATVPVSPMEFRPAPGEEFTGALKRDADKSSVVDLQARIRDLERKEDQIR